MKKTAPAILMALAIATLAFLSLSCSRSTSPAQSTFVAEHGLWFWLESEGGVDNDTIQVDSVDYFRYLSFSPLDTVWQTSVSKGSVATANDFEVGYSVRYEDHNSERVKVLHYDGDVHAAQIMEFMGSDTLVLTDLSIYGFTHKYRRLR